VQTADCGSGKACANHACVTCQTQSNANVLKNAGFDGALTSWTTAGGGTATYDGSNDADGCPTSGSAKLTAGAEISECRPIVGEKTYYLEFRYKQSVAGAAGCQLDFYEGLDCSGTLASDMQLIGQETGTSWKHQTLGEFTGVKTMTALVTCFVAMKGATVEFDQIYLGAGTNDF
jgi:hypothetical protein